MSFFLQHPPTSPNVLGRSIKRIVFSTTTKQFGRVVRPLSVSEIKQIGGRAGRYRVAGQQEGETSDPSSPSVGLVTTLYGDDLPVVQRAMAVNAEPILTAGLIPTDDVIHRFAAYFPPDTPFSLLLRRIAELSQCHSQFRLCDLTPQMQIADVINDVKGLNTADRITICAAPVNLRQAGAEDVLQALALAVAKQQVITLPDIEPLELEVLDEPLTPDRLYLNKLEALHSGLVLYLWLSYRYETIFTSRSLAFHVKEMVETKINNVLAQMPLDRQGEVRRVYTQRTESVVEGVPEVARASAAL